MSSTLTVFSLEIGGAERILRRIITDVSLDAYVNAPGVALGAMLPLGGTRPDGLGITDDREACRKLRPSTFGQARRLNLPPPARRSPMIPSAIAAKLKSRSKDDFKGHHFEAGLIVQAVSWYLRYPLSYRYIEDCCSSAASKSPQHREPLRAGLRAPDRAPAAAVPPAPLRVGAGRRGTGVLDVPKLTSRDIRGLPSQRDAARLASHRSSWDQGLYALAGARHRGLVLVRTIGDAFGTDDLDLLNPDEVQDGGQVGR